MLELPIFHLLFPKNKNKTTVWGTKTVVWLHEEILHFYHCNRPTWTDKTVSILTVHPVPVTFTESSSMFDEVFFISVETLDSIGQTVYSWKTGKKGNGRGQGCNWSGLSHVTHSFNFSSSFHLFISTSKVELTREFTRINLLPSSNRVYRRSLKQYNLSWETTDFQRSFRHTKIVPIVDPDLF